jgi:uncharacterized protein YbjT (DUF2867 family)
VSIGCRFGQLPRRGNGLHFFLHLTASAMHATSRVLVIGATGTIGREVVRALLDEGVAVRATSRRPETAALPPGAEVAACDLTIPESLDAPLRGVDAVFLIWTAPPPTVTEVISRIAERARRIVFLSAPHRTPHPFFQQPNPMARLHASIEQAIVDTGVAATILRPGMLAANAAGWWAAQIRSGDVVQWPYAAAASAPIDERDIAAVAARTLRDSTTASLDYVLTGPEALTHADQVRIIGEVLGRPLRLHELSPNEFRRIMADQIPPAVIDMLLNAWAASVGIPPFMTSAVSEITGRPARSFREWVARAVQRHGAGSMATTNALLFVPSSPSCE